jgi:hypothetical protein
MSKSMCTIFHCTSQSVITHLDTEMTVANWKRVSGLGQGFTGEGHDDHAKNGGFQPMRVPKIIQFYGRIVHSNKPIGGSRIFQETSKSVVDSW